MGMLSRFRTEDLILHKQSGETCTVKALVDTEKIFTEHSEVVIEEDDWFERHLPNGAAEYYLVIDRGFFAGQGTIKDHYQTKVRKIKEPPQQETAEKKRLIFISHSSKDQEYTKAFVDFLFAIGLNEDDIVCSSYPGVGVPLGEKVYEWLVSKFQEKDLHVVYFLSHNYYKSAASLNEMGAAWAMKQKWDGILLPGFEFSEIAGCIDPRQIGIKLDGDINELKHRLGELKDNIVREFGLRIISVTRWEKIRDSFIESVLAIETTETEEVEPEVYSNPDRSSISIYACVMLLFAAEDNGQIMVVNTLSNISYQAGKHIMERSQSPRELAHWEGAVNQLLAKGYILCVGNKDRIYRVTEDGYSLSDQFKESNELDAVSQTPSEILLSFDEPQE